jgi:hypothetical protein
MTYVTLSLSKGHMNQYNFFIVPFFPFVLVRDLIRNHDSVFTEHFSSEIWILMSEICLKETAWAWMETMSCYPSHRRRRGWGMRWKETVWLNVKSFHRHPSSNWPLQEFLRETFCVISVYSHAVASSMTDGYGSCLSPFLKRLSL